MNIYTSQKMLLNDVLNNLISHFLTNKTLILPYQTENTLIGLKKQNLKEYQSICKQNKMIRSLENSGWFFEISFNETWFDFGNPDRHLCLWMSKSPRKSGLPWFWEKEAKNKPFTKETLYQTWHQEFDEKSHFNNQRTYR